MINCECKLNNNQNMYNKFNHVKLPNLMPTQILNRVMLAGWDMYFLVVGVWAEIKGQHFECYF